MLLCVFENGADASENNEASPRPLVVEGVGLCGIGWQPLIKRILYREKNMRNHNSRPSLYAYQSAAGSVVPLALVSLLCLRSSYMHVPVGAHESSYSAPCLETLLNPSVGRTHDYQ